MVAATLALIPYAGWIYGVFAAALGVWFLAEAHRLNARVTASKGAQDVPGPSLTPAASAAGGSSPAPMRLFHLSIAYLTLLFAAVAVTALLPWGRW
jgi:protoheme IX farnesyltransferase